MYILYTICKLVFANYMRIYFFNCIYVYVYVYYICIICFYCFYYYYALFSSMFILHFVYHCLSWYVIHVHCLWYVIHVHCLWYVIHVHCLCYVIHLLFYRLISYICVCKLIAHKQLCSYFIDFLNAISIPQSGFLTKYYDNG